MGTERSPRFLIVSNLFLKLQLWRDHTFIKTRVLFSFSFIFQSCLIIYSIRIEKGLKRDSFLRIYSPYLYFEHDGCSGRGVLSSSRWRTIQSADWVLQTKTFSVPLWPFPVFDFFLLVAMSEAKIEWSDATKRGSIPSHPVHGNMWTHEHVDKGEKTEWESQ